MPEKVSPATLIISPILILCTLFFLTIHLPLTSTDTYFHLAIGRQVASTKQIPKVDTFTFVAQNKPFVSNEWLSGLIFYTVYQGWDQTGILALRATIGILIIFFLYQILKNLKVKFELIVLFLMLNAFTLGVRMIDRPEMFSFLLFTIIIYVFYRALPQMRQARRNPVILLLPLIFLLWPNIQGYAPLGLATFGYLTVRTALEEIAQVSSSLKKAFTTHKFIIIIFLTAALVSFVQFKRFLYVLFLNRELFAYVVEVQSIAQKLASIKYNFWANVPVEIYIWTSVTLVGLLSFLPRFKSKHPPVVVLDLIFFATLATVSFLFIRIIPVYVLLVTPIVAQNLPRTERKETTRFLLVRGETLLLATLLLATAITISILQGKQVGNRTNSLYVQDRQGQVLVATTTTWLNRQPTAALDFIQKNLEPQKVLTSLNWSNQVIWQLETTVFGDIIYEKQTPETLADYTLLKTGRDSWQEVLSKYKPDVVINTQPFNLVEFFQVPIWQDEKWFLVYVDEVAIVYTSDQKYRSLALNTLHPETSADFKFNLEEKDKAKEELEKLLFANPKNAFAREQLVLLLTASENYELATSLAGKGAKLLPENPNFYLLAAYAKTLDGKCSDIAPLLEKAKARSGGYYFLQRKIEALAKKCSLKV